MERYGSNTQSSVNIEHSRKSAQILTMTEMLEENQMIETLPKNTNFSFQVSRAQENYIYIVSRLSLDGTL